MKTLLQADSLHPLSQDLTVKEVGLQGYRPADITGVVVPDVIVQSLHEMAWLMSTESQKDKSKTNLVFDDISLRPRAALADGLEIDEAYLADAELGDGYVDQGLLLKLRTDIAVEKVILALLQ